MRIVNVICPWPGNHIRHMCEECDHIRHIRLSLNFSYTPGCSVEYCSSIYRDCDDYWFLNHKKSGVYRVIPKDMTRGYDVYCEMTADSAWLVRQIPLATSTTINYLYRSPKLS